MSRGYDTHQQRQMELSMFGKDLARRAKSKCELTGAAGVPLHIYEIPPIPGNPDPGRCLMISEKVIDQLQKPSTIVADQWRNLGESIWSDIGAVQIMSHRLLTHIAKQHLWAQEILNDAYLDEDILSIASEQSL